MASTNGVGSLQNVTGAQPLSVAREAARTEHAAPASTTAQTTLNSSDSAQLSSTSTLFSAALATPEVRFEKVSSLQALIGDGSYYVASTDVAGRIVDGLLA